MSQACYIIRAVKPFFMQDVLKMIYYAYCHSVVTYGLLFWGNSLHSIEVLRLKKEIIRIMMGARSRDPAKNFLKF